MFEDRRHFIASSTILAFLLPTLSALRCIVYWVAPASPSNARRVHVSVHEPGPRPRQTRIPTLKRTLAQPTQNDGKYLLCPLWPYDSLTVCVTIADAVSFRPGSKLKALRVCWTPLQRLGFSIRSNAPSDPGFSVMSPSVSPLSILSIRQMNPIRKSDRLPCPLCPYQHVYTTCVRPR